MFAVLMACFAVVIGVVALGAVALLISRLSALARGWDFRLDQLEQKARTKEPAAVQAAVDDLRAALDVLRGSNRKELGALWARVGGRGPQRETFDTQKVGDTFVTEREFEAMIELQRAPPVKP